jgi:hypothetical protein
VSLDKEADGMQNERPIGSSQEAEECEQLDNLLERTTISGSNFVPYSFGPKNYDMLAHQTSFCEDGRRRAVFDFNVYSQHKRNYLVTMGEGGNSFSLQTRVSPIFLDIEGRGAIEYSRRNADTHTFLAAIRESADTLYSEIGSDIDQVWTEENEYDLPFSCAKKFHMQLMWHQGCAELLQERSSSRSNVEDNAVHQQTAVLRLTFVGSEDQGMAGTRAEDLVFNSPLGCNRMSGGIPPPGPGFVHRPSTGGGSYGAPPSGGFAQGGGGSRGNLKGPFNVSNTTSLVAMNHNFMDQNRGKRTKVSVKDASDEDTEFGDV